MAQKIEILEAPFYSIDIPDTESLMKENSEWFKVDLPKKVLKHKKKPDWLRVKLPIGPKYTKLRKLVDDGKKELGNGIVVVFTSKDDKVGVAVGITNKLTEKFNAVNFVKLSSEIIGGQGGGGRKDFAQAGGQDQSKILEAFEKIKNLI